MLPASATESRSGFSHFCWVGVGRWLARCASRFGRIASDSAGAPPQSERVDLRVRARMLSHRAVLAGAPLPVGVLASAGRRSGFGFSSLGLRVTRLPVSGSRFVCGVAACGSPASAVTSALTIRPSRRRFAARLNSGVRPEKKALLCRRLQHQCRALLLSLRAVRLRLLARDSQLLLRAHRFGQRGCAAAKCMS